MQLKYTTNFYLEKREQFKISHTSGFHYPNAPILMFFSFDRKRLQYYTGYRIDSSKWDEQIQRVRKNTFNQDGISAQEINEHLNLLQTTIQEIFKQYKYLNKTITAQTLRQELRNRTGTEQQQSQTVMDCFSEYIEFKKKTNTTGTVKKYITIRNQLTEFQKKINHRIEYDDIDDTFLYRFLDFQRQDLGHRNSTMAKSMKLLKAFLRWANKKGYNSNLSFTGFQPGLKGVDSYGCSKEKKVIFLTWPELMHLYEMKIDKTYLQHTRDVFCFCCFTGLRHSDAFNLKRSNIKDGYIEVSMIKTEEPIKVNLNKYSQSILNKYIGEFFRDDKCLPVISNQKMNDYLKELGQLAEFTTKENIVYYKGPDRVEETYFKWELLTTHVGKKTFITNAFFLGIPLEIVKSWTGNKDDRVFRAYFQILDSHKKREMEKFNQ